MQIRWKSHVSFPLSEGRWPSLIKQNRYIRKYYEHQLLLNGFLKLVPFRTHKMVANALTKSLPSPAFVEHPQIMTGHASFAAKLFRCVGG